MARVLTRKRFLLTGGAATAAAAGGAGIGLLGAVASARNAPSPEQDRRILAFLLELQRAEDALYGGARRAGAFGGELGEFVDAAGADERRHVAALAAGLGAQGRAPAPAPDPGDTLRSPRAFAAKAVALEDAVVAACNGQATHLTTAALARVMSVVSVEARHAAWIRDLAGLPPAAAATDAPRDPGDIRDALRREGLLA